MNAHKRKDTDPEEYEPAETIVLEEDAVMETSEFRKLGALDPDSFDEIGPPDLDD